MMQLLGLSMHNMKVEVNLMGALKNTEEEYAYQDVQEFSIALKIGNEMFET